MGGTRIALSRRLVGLATAALAVAVLAAFGAGVAAADPVTGSDANGTYLALGDSVAFGYVPAEAVPAPNYLVAHSFVGYPEYLAQQLRERVWNASCPGETTASMLDATAQSNGCENSVGSPVGYRTLYPLHVQYQGSQMDYALKYLTDHKHTRLVTIDIGANDAFVCQETTIDRCSSPAELLGLAHTIQANLASIYTQLRSVYQGPIVALTYYSLSYTRSDADRAGAVPRLGDRRGDERLRRHRRRRVRRLPGRVRPERRSLRRRAADQAARRQLQHPPVGGGAPGAGGRDRAGDRGLIVG